MITLGSCHFPSYVIFCVAMNSYRSAVESAFMFRRFACFLVGGTECVVVSSLCLLYVVSVCVRFYVLARWAAVSGS